jgi:hypothetical protein
MRANGLVERESMHTKAEQKQVASIIFEGSAKHFLSPKVRLKKLTSAASSTDTRPRAIACGKRVGHGRECAKGDIRR